MNGVVANGCGMCKRHGVIVDGDSNQCQSMSQLVNVNVEPIGMCSEKLFKVHCCGSASGQRRARVTFAQKREEQSPSPTKCNFHHLKKHFDMKARVVSIFRAMLGNLLVMFENVDLIAKV